MTALVLKRKLKVKRRMGVFYVDCEVENLRQAGRKTTVPDLLVDTGSLHTRLPAEILKQLGIEVFKKDVPFETATGQIIKRPMGFALLRAAGFATVDQVVFAQRGDLSLLGATTLEGFGAVVDPNKEKLMGAGPKPAARTSKRKKNKQ